MDEARRAFGPRLVVEEAPYVAKNGKNNEPESLHIREYRIPFDLTGKGAHFKNARHWNYTQQNNTADPALYFFQLLVLQMETHSEGSLRPKVTEQSDAKEYWKLVTVAGKISIGKASTDEQKYFRRMTVCDSRVSLKFLHDVAIERDRAKFQEMHKKGQKKGKQPKKKKRKTQQPERPKTVSLNFVREDLVLHDDQVYDESPQYMESMKRAAVDAYMLARYRVACHNLEDEDSEDEHSQAIDDEDPDSFPGMPERVPWLGDEDLVSKVQFTFTAVPREGGDKKNPDDIAAIMCSFFVRDPEWNPGNFFQRVLQNNANRELPKNRGRGVDEMFPNYATMLDGLHPAAKSNKLQTYFQCALKYDPSVGKDRDGNTVPRHLLQQRMDSTSYGGSFHLSQILTLQNALKVMERAGCDAEYLQESEWRDREAHQAVFPGDLDTYKYISDGVFWYHKTYIGLREQLFPYVSLDGDFLAQLMSGADPSALIREDGEAVVRDGEELDVQKISSAMREIREMIARDWKVDRSRLQDKKLVNYNTNNEFVHRYIESLMVNSQVMKYYPKNAVDLWYRVQEAKYECVNIYNEPESQWRTYLDAEWHEVLDRYMVYKKIRVRAQLACMKIFHSLWLLEGNIDDLPIPEMIKVVQKWYREMHQSKLPNMTRNFKMFDRELGKCSVFFL